MKKITAFFLNLRIGQKFNLIFGVFIAFSLLSLFILYKTQVNKTLRDVHTMQMESLRDITEMLGLVSTFTPEEGFSESDYALLKPFFQKKKYYETGYPFLVSKTGDYLIHPWKEGKNELESANHVQRLSFGEGEGFFRYHFSLDGKFKWQYVIYFKPYDAYVTATFYEYEFLKELSNMRILLLVFILLSVIIMLLLRYFVRTVVGGLAKGVAFAQKASEGDLSMELNVGQEDEIGQMASALNKLREGLYSSALFAQKIGEGMLDEDYKALGEHDILGKALLNMRDSLRHAKHEEEIRRSEDEKRNWASNGLADFGEVLRQNNSDIGKLSDSIIKKIVVYLGINQGGLFLVDQIDHQPCLKLTACYAYDRKKFIENTIMPGEGLVGACFLEKKTSYITKLPQGYTFINSGLGGETPSALLIVPVMINGEVHGVIELASFHPFKAHEIEFVEKICENIASVISSVKVNIQTAYLLEQSQQQAEEMKAQEEEMRQNMEELMATQEEMARKERDYQQQNAMVQKLFSVIEVDSAGKIIYINGHFESLSHYSANDILGRKADCLFLSPEGNLNGDYQTWLQTISEGVSTTLTIKRYRKNGEAFTVKAALHPVFGEDGQIIKIVEFSLSI